MNILLVSQCQKNALTETRRILDQFAERCGDRIGYGKQQSLKQGWKRCIKCYVKLRVKIRR